MGDGVERALARAAELEALVHNEVAALERAYNDNELRIRGLIEDLANQRDSLVGQAEQVRNAITGVHLGLTQDIASVSEMVAASVNDAAQRVTRVARREGRAHHARARSRRRHHDRGDRRARRRPARADDPHQRGGRAHARDRERQDDVEHRRQVRPPVRTDRRSHGEARPDAVLAARPRHRQRVAEDAGDRRDADAPHRGHLHQPDAHHRAAHRPDDVARDRS